MLGLGQNLGLLLDRADEIVQRMETVQAALISILEDLKAGDVQPDEVVILRNQNGQVTGVEVVEMEDESDED